MTPIADIAESIEHGEPSHISTHSVRDRMRFVDACITELVEAIHPFLGPRRIEAFYESKVDSNIPQAIEATRKMMVVFHSLLGTEPTVNKKGYKPRHFNRTYNGAPTTKRPT